MSPFRPPYSLLLKSLVFGAMMVAAPLAVSGLAPLGAGQALAGNGHGGGQGNGGGHAGGHGKAGEHSQASDKSKGARATAGAKNKIRQTTIAALPQPSRGHTIKGKKSASSPLAASSLGKLNGFLHASTTALQQASPKSAIGMISKTYAGQLADYLSGSASQSSSPGVTLDQLAETLARATNKPLTADALNAIHARLAELDPSLAQLTDPSNQALVNSLVEKVNALKTASTQ